MYQVLRRYCTIAGGLPVREHIKHVKNQVTRTEPVCLPIRHGYLLSVRAQLLRGLANHAHYIQIATPWYCTTRIPSVSHLRCLTKVSPRTRAPRFLSRPIPNGPNHYPPCITVNDLGPSILMRFNGERKGMGISGVPPGCHGANEGGRNNRFGLCRG